MIGLAALIALAAALVFIIRNKRRQDTSLNTFYKQLIASNDINEIFNLFSSMVKHCFNLSIKTIPQSAVRSSLPDPALAEQVAGIMAYMEAHDEKSCDHLKGKIKVAYQKIKATA
jgi:hypothetical protein